MISDKVCKLQVVSRKDIPVSVLVICLLGTARLREGGVIGVLPICLTLIQEWKVANPFFTDVQYLIYITLASFHFII